ncbi:CPBP family intramembrane glutamic endopeptidase [Streptococcus suis]
MRNLIEKFKTFLLAGYGSHVLLGFILGWALLKLNGFVLLLILQFSSYWVKLFFQLTCLTLLIVIPLILVMRQAKLIKVNIEWRLSRASMKEISLSWLCMIIVSLLLGYVSSLLGIESSNQKELLSVMDKVPLIVFLIYLLVASVLEEVVYRGVLFGLSGIPMVDIILTSLLFSLHHNPTYFMVLVAYFVLGLFIGNIRYRRGLLASVVLHVLWNLTVLAWSFCF